jgi:hypothetical protein
LRILPAGNFRQLGLASAISGIFSGDHFTPKGTDEELIGYALD